MGVLNGLTAGERENSREVSLPFRVHSRGKPGVPVQRKNLNKSDIFLPGYHSLLWKTLSIQKKSKGRSFGDSWGFLNKESPLIDSLSWCSSTCGRDRSSPAVETRYLFRLAKHSMGILNALNGDLRPAQHRCRDRLVFLQVGVTKHVKQPGVRPTLEPFNSQSVLWAKRLKDDGIRIQIAHIPSPVSRRASKRTVSSSR